MIIAYLLLVIVFIVVSTTKYKLHPFLAFILAAFGYGLCVGMPFSDIVASVNKGFGDIVGYIGIADVLGQALAVTAVCSGAMVVSHVNDSFFWLVTQLSGMNIKTGYKLH